MEEKFKFARLIYCESAIEKLRFAELPVDYAQALNKFLKEVNPQYKKFQETNNKLVTEKYGVEKDGVWDIPKENLTEFQKEIHPTLEEDIECEVPKFSLSRIMEFNPHFCISQDTLNKLENFLIIE